MPRDYPTPLLVWTWQDPQVEQPRLLDAALRDIAASGFSGALAMLRGCRYALSNPLVVRAAGHAAEAAHRLGLAFWFALDPRLDQGRLIALPGGRATYLLTGREAGGAMPCETTVDREGRYRVRLDYGEPRGQHMLSEVAVTFEPEAVERVFAYRKAADGAVLAGTLRDVTADARLFVQRQAGYLEIFGRAAALDGEGWHALALPRVRSTYPELGGAAVQEAMLDLYRSYHRAGVALDGVFWDEIGYVTGYGGDRCRLPCGPAIREAFRARHGADLGNAIPFLLLDDDAGRAAGVRRDYYAAVQDVVVAAQERCHAEARRLWGPDVESGIHQTWHQNADDLPHGTGDWWRGSVALSGGFTDVGDAERVDQEEHLAEILAMTAIAVSLARHHERPLAFCNLWGVDYGEAGSRAPAEIVDWWAHLLSAFGVVWLAHTYGPNGYVDRVTGWGPGYPDHPTWEQFAAVNPRVARVREITGGALPEANVAVVYPLETLARIGDARANPVARDAQRTVAVLLRRGLAVDVLSPSLFAAGEVADGALRLRTPRGAQRYAAVVYPHPHALQPGEMSRLEELDAAGVPVLLLGLTPAETTEGVGIASSVDAGLETRLSGEEAPPGLSADAAGLDCASATLQDGPAGDFSTRLIAARMAPTANVLSPGGASWPQPGVSNPGTTADELESVARDLPRLVEAPPGALANLFYRADGTAALVVVPAELGKPVDGEVRASGVRLTLSGLRGIAAVRFDQEGTVLDRFVHDGALADREEAAR